MALLKESNFGGSLGSHFKLRLEYTYTQNIGTNKTTITYTLKMVSQDGYSAGGSANSITGYIGGTASGDIVGRASGIGVNSTITLGTRVYEITHNADGTFPNTNYSARIDTAYSNVNRAEVSGTLTSSNIPRINRIATILTAEDFTDEGNPTITFNNPSNYTAKPYITFYDNDGTLVHLLYRDISATSPYTWDITNEERTALRNATNQQPTYNAWLGADTYDGNTKLGADSMGKTFTIVNADPTISTAITEQNANVISALGGSQTNYVVASASELLFDITASALKGSTLSRVMVNGQLATLDNGTYKITLSDIQTNTFVVEAVDSRGNTTTDTITKTLIAYVPTKINTWSIERETAISSDFLLNANITCYSGTFNATQNTATIKYSLDNSTWTTIPSSSYTFSSNVITITDYEMQNLIPYTDYGTFYLKVEDLITSNQENKAIAKGVETYSWGENDLQVNGDIFLGDTDGNNIKNIYGYDILWEDANGIQPNGQVLDLDYNIYNYRFVILVGEYGNNCFMPVIPNDQNLFGGGMQPSASGNKFYTFGIQSYITYGGEKLSIDSYCTIGHNSNGSHDVMWNPLLYKLIGVR